jgi:hypothetical protein
MQWLEDTIRSIPLVTRVLLISLLAVSLGWMAEELAFWIVTI